MIPLMRPHERLIVWQRSIELTAEAYRLSTVFPRHELFGLTSQLRRACVSVAANIAEGNGRTRREYLHFLGIARGSLNEVETHLHIARVLQLATPEQLTRATTLCDEVGKMLTVLRRNLSRHPTPHSPLPTP